MNYYIAGLLNIFLISIYSVSLNKIFKINISQTFLIVCCLISFLFFISFNLSVYLFQFFFFKELYYLLIFFSIYLFFYLKLFEFSKIDKRIIEFIILAIFILFFSHNNYFLDEDEFQYYGQILKSLKLLNNFTSFQNEFLNNPQSKNFYLSFYANTTIFFNFFFIILINFSENILIFSNNFILISCFFFLLNEKNNFILRFFYFLIFYILLNNFSFGFMSIYPDAILISIFACTLGYIMLNNKKEINLQNYIVFTILCVSLFLTKRSGAIYLSLLIMYIFLFSNMIKFQFYKKLLIIITIMFVLISIKLEPWTSGDQFLIVLKNYIFHNFKVFLYDFFYLFKVPIYFSQFLVSVKIILQKLDLFLIIKPFSLSIFYWFLFTLLALILFIRDRSFILFYLLGFFIVCFINLAWVNNHNMHPLVMGRYIGVFLCSFLLFAVFNNSLNFKNSNIHKGLIACFFIFISLFLPNKSFGYFLNDRLYHSTLENKIFKFNRDIIKAHSDKHKNRNKFNVFFYNTNYEKISLYYTILKYEFFVGKKNNTIHIFDHEVEKYQKYVKKNETSFFIVNINEKKMNDKINLLTKDIGNVTYINLK